MCGWELGFHYLPKGSTTEDGGHRQRVCPPLSFRMDLTPSCTHRAATHRRERRRNFALTSGNIADQTVYRPSSLSSFIDIKRAHYSVYGIPHHIAALMPVLLAPTSYFERYFVVPPSGYRLVCCRYKRCKGRSVLSDAARVENPLRASKAMGDIEKRN